MTSLRPFRCDDLFRFNNVNVDVLTETFNLGFYLSYLAKHPEYYSVAEGAGGRTMGYIMGKAEGVGAGRRVSVTTSAHTWRRDDFRASTHAPTPAHAGAHARVQVTERRHNAYFVDLFVRVSNSMAISMYEGFGYIVYRRVLGYYSSEEDAFDMRKAMPRDRDKKSVVPLKKPVHPWELEWS
eukprot:PRCOL_00006102-RA